MINLNERPKHSQPLFPISSKEQLHFTPGIWIDGKGYWLHTHGEKVIYDKQIVLKVKQEQVHSKIRLFHLYLSNHSSLVRNLKILGMHYHSCLSNDHFTFASPNDRMIFHLAEKEMFLVNGIFNGKRLEEYTIHSYWNSFTDEIWSDMDKGTLKYQPMVKGPAVSIFSFEAAVRPRDHVKVNTWIINGRDKQEIIALNQALLKNTLAFPFQK